MIQGHWLLWRECPIDQKKSRETSSEVIVRVHREMLVQCILLWESWFQPVLFLPVTAISAFTFIPLLGSTSVFTFVICPTCISQPQALCNYSLVEMTTCHASDVCASFSHSSISSAQPKVRDRFNARHAACVYYVHAFSECVFLRWF